MRQKAYKADMASRLACGNSTKARARLEALFRVMDRDSCIERLKDRVAALF
jgi:hypothetical protein